MEKPAACCMSTELITAHANESIETAYAKMKNFKIRHLPVVSDRGDVVGIISDRDFQRAMKPDMRDYTSFQSEQADFEPGAQVQDFMSWPIKAVSVQTDLRLVVDTMIENKISAILVTRNERVVGIVTHEDLLCVLRHLLNGDEGLSLKIKDRVDVLYQTTLEKVARFFGNPALQ